MRTEGPIRWIDLVCQGNMPTGQHRMGAEFSHQHASSTGPRQPGKRQELAGQWNRAQRLNALPRLVSLILSALAEKPQRHVKILLRQRGKPFDLRRQPAQSSGGIGFQKSPDETAQAAFSIGVSGSQWVLW